MYKFKCKKYARLEMDRLTEFSNTILGKFLVFDKITQNDIHVSFT